MLICIEVDQHHNYFVTEQPIFENQSPSTNRQAQARGYLVHNKLTFGNGNNASTTSDVTTTYIGSLYEETNGIGTKFVYLGGTKIAAIKDGGEIFYYHGDHLGGTNVITRNDGAKKEVVEYTPFGECSRLDKYGNDEEVAWHYFTGQRYDDETGLYYYGARYYDPSLGRFLTPDTFVQSPGGNPQTFNRYSYTGNNPVNRTDPSGHFFKKLWNWFKKNTIVGGFIDALGTGDWAQFGRQVAVLTISAAANVFLPGIGATFSSNFFANAGLHILRGAAIGAAVGGISSTIMGGSFAQGARIGGITGGVMGAFQGVTTSEQFQNWRAGNGFRSNGSVANSSQAPEVAIAQQTEDATGTYGKFRLSVKRGSGSSGMGGSSGDSWGHAWISHKKGDGPWTSNGFWPGEGAGKEAIFGNKYSGVLTELNGILDSVGKADAFRQWSLSQGQYDNLVQYINNFKQNSTQWSLSVNCTDFATGAARSIGIDVPNVNTGPFQDPNKLGNWLNSGQ